MSSLLQQRCLHHLSREAVARCPECTGYFCRECIVEHEDRVVCAACLGRLVKKVETKSDNQIWSVLQPCLGAFAGLWLAWLCFYWLGRLLVVLPAEFHADIFAGQDAQKEETQ